MPLMEDPGQPLVCNDKLRQHVAANLERFAARDQQRPGSQRAAVAIAVVDARYDPGIPGIPHRLDRASAAAVVLTRRSAKLRRHAGQWALPGGRIDVGESAEQAALRELEEEVGLRLSAERVVGRLDDYVTRSGYTITPLVVWGGSGVTLTANPAEVASIHRIPLAEFLRPDAPILRPTPDAEHPVLLMPVGDSWIAAPTAALLYQFREVALLGKELRVAHYEQPRFAWR